ncbi:hypothetical protein WNY37_08145 [Henriciella sp. AS95]|uniref:hypothetical protein n=1 Tax=Henriciella sp. AS95 TaxID=3135782 RepID=UPI00317CF3A2
MPRLKAMLAVASLTSFTRRAGKPKADLAFEPIRRPLDDCKGDVQDDWLFDADHERSAHSDALNALSASMGRLRETLSRISIDSPIFVEAEPAMSLGTMSFDNDLFDGEPMMVSAHSSSQFDDLLFDEQDVASISFAAETDTQGLFRQAA